MDVFFRYCCTRKRQPLPMKYVIGDLAMAHLELLQVGYLVCTLRYVLRVLAFSPFLSASFLLSSSPSLLHISLSLSLSLYDSLPPPIIRLSLPHLFSSFLICQTVSSMAHFYHKKCIKIITNPTC